MKRNISNTKPTSDCFSPSSVFLFAENFSVPESIRKEISTRNRYELLTVDEMS
jgi:hypothetical protein